MTSRVLITGGSGFLGRGLLRYARSNTSNWDAEFIVYSRDEYKQDLCRAQYGTDGISYILGDVRDYDRLVKASHGCDVIIHTAAIKYIPEAEFNVDEAIAVNVDGSRNVLKAAYYNHIRTVVGISTDKACAPINTYGMTKALMERLFGEYSGAFHCALARYGNVIGSTGSVIPKFRQQLKDTGKLTLTDPEMTRYWITIDEACQLIELAMSVNSGSVVIPKPRAMQMVTLAQALIQHDDPLKQGFSNCIDIIGKRPGEKMHESLLHEQESIRAAEHDRYYELFKVGSGPYSEPFELDSNSPEGGWITSKELIEAADDAELV